MPLVTVVCTGVSIATLVVMIAFTSMVLTRVLGQNDVVLPLPLTNGYNITFTRFAAATALPQIPIVTYTYVNYAMSPLQVRPSLSQLSLSTIFDVGICCGICFLLSGSHVTDISTNGSLEIGVCTTRTLWNTSLEQHMCLQVLINTQTSGALSSYFPTVLSGGHLMLLKQLSLGHSINMVEHTAWELCRKSPDPSAFSTW